MIKNKLSLLVFLSVIMAIGHAADRGRITFTGQIVAPPCSISRQATDQILGFDNGVWQGNEHEAQRRNFYFDVEGCKVATMQSMRVVFKRAEEEGVPPNLALLNPALIQEDGNDKLQFSVFLKKESIQTLLKENEPVRGQIILVYN